MEETRINKQNLIVVGVIVLSLVLGVVLLGRQQIFKSKAGTDVNEVKVEDVVTIADEDGNPVLFYNDGVFHSKTKKVKLTIDRNRLNPVASDQSDVVGTPEPPRTRPQPSLINTEAGGTAPAVAPIVDVTWLSFWTGTGGEIIYWHYSCPTPGGSYSDEECRKVMKYKLTGIEGAVNNMGHSNTSDIDRSYGADCLKYKVVYTGGVDPATKMLQDNPQIYVEGQRAIALGLKNDPITTQVPRGSRLLKGQIVYDDGQTSDVDIQVSDPPLGSYFCKK